MSDKDGTKVTESKESDIKKSQSKKNTEVSGVNNSVSNTHTNTKSTADKIQSVDSHQATKSTPAAQFKPKSTASATTPTTTASSTTKSTSPPPPPKPSTSSTKSTSTSSSTSSTPPPPPKSTSTSTKTETLSSSTPPPQPKQPQQPPQQQQDQTISTTVPDTSTSTKSTTATTASIHDDVLKVSDRIKTSEVRKSIPKYSKISEEPISVPKITSNYFCFDCGAIWTTVEDKEQHLIIEKERRKTEKLIAEE